MTRVFEERERAAETGFARAEEVRFLARRRGIEALARWAAQNMEMPSEAAAAYPGAIVAKFVEGACESELVARVQTDLERAGRPALSTTASAILMRATADAADDLRGLPHRGA